MTDVFVLKMNKNLPSSERLLFCVCIYIYIYIYIKHVCTLCIIDTHTIFDGLTHNARGYFASCEIFFRASDEARKIRAMSKIFACILCLTIKYSERITHILEKAEGSMVSTLPNIFYFHD